MAEASVFVMQLDKKTYDSQTQSMQCHINVGFGSDITIKELAQAVAKATGYQGKISFDRSKPDGPPQKWMNSGRLKQLGWEAKTDLENGLKLVYTNFCAQN